MIKLIDIIKEVLGSREYKIDGILMADTTKRQLSDILSDIRALTGVTIVRVTNNKQPSAEKLKKYVVDLSVKIDPAPFETFDHTTIDSIIEKINHIPAVRIAKFGEKAQLTKK